MLDEERQARLRRAGARFRAADRERAAALAELKAALAEADGDSTPGEAARLTGLPVDVSELFLEVDAEDAG